MSKKNTQENLLDEFRTFQKRRGGLEDRWMSYYEKVYMQRAKTKVELENIALGITADIKIPRELSHIETKRPRHMNTLFGQKPMVRALPNDDESVKMCEPIQSLVDQSLKNYLYVPYWHSYTQSQITGTGWYGLDWIDEKIGGKVIHRLGFEFYDCFGVYVNDAAITLRDVEVVYRRMVKTKSYLDKKMKDGNYDIKNIEDIPKFSASMGRYTDSTYTRRQEIAGLRGGNNEITMAYGGKSKEDLYEYIEEVRKDKICTLINGKLVKEAKPLVEGIIPIYPVLNYPCDVMFYGIGEIQLLADIPAYANEIKNLRMDVIRRVAHPAALISRTAFIKKEDLVTRPFQTIMTSDMDGYREVQKADVKRILVEEEYIAKSDQEDATSIYSYIKGGDAPRAETATTAITMKEAALERINCAIAYNCELSLKKLCQDMTTIMQKKLKDDVWYRYTDPEYKIKIKSIPIDVIMQSVSWEISAFNIKSIADVNIQQNMMNIYDRLKDRKNINPYFLDLEMLEVYDFKNKNELMVKDDIAMIIDMMKKDPKLSQYLLGQSQMFQEQQTMQKNPTSPTLPGMTNPSGMAIPGTTMNPEITPPMEDMTNV